MLSPGQALAVAWHNKFLIKGRARRSEYWWTVLWTSLLIGGMALIDMFIFPQGVSGDMPFDYATSGWSGFLNDLNAFPLSNFFYALLLFPLIFQAMRRLHDTGRQGWLAIVVGLLTALIPYIPDEDLTSLFLRFQGVSWNSLRPSPVSWWLIGFWAVYFLLCLWQFVLNVLPSQKGENRFGPNPIGEGNFDVFN